MFGTLIDYWYLTGDTTYNDNIIQGIVHQAGEARDLMPANQTSTEGNDDQGFWAMAAMSAAENVFPNPPSDKPQWLALAQAVFNLYVSRWDEAHCDGGLRWQIFSLNNGYDYKNSISNGCFFNIAARLARYTGNDTYAEWAGRVYDWQHDIGFIRSDFTVQDGADIGDGCQNRDEIKWSYNSGILIHGAAALYNATGEDKWKDRLDGLLDSAEKTFFNDSVVVEQQCEPWATCNTDQRSFKGYLLRWLASTALLVPDTSDKIRPLLRASAEAAAASCVGSPGPELFSGIKGTACGQAWTEEKFDGYSGVGEQMNALAAVQYVLAEKTAGPVTADNGGTSKGDPGAGEASVHKYDLPPIKTGDRVGAGILTAMICAGVIAGCVFVIR